MEMTSRNDFRANEISCVTIASLVRLDTKEPINLPFRLLKLLRHPSSECR